MGVLIIVKETVLIGWNWGVMTVKGIVITIITRIIIILLVVIVIIGIVVIIVS